MEGKERMAKSNRETGARSQEKESKPITNKPPTTPAPPEQVKKQQPAVPINKEAKKELQKQQRLFQQLEEQIASLQKKKAELEAALTSPEIYSDKQKFTQAEANYKKAADDLLRMNKEYEIIFEKIMELESQ